MIYEIAYLGTMKTVMCGAKTFVKIYMWHELKRAQ